MAGDPHRGGGEDAEARVLAVYAGLRDAVEAVRTGRDRAAISTAEVDGAFYWGAARTDFVARVAALRADLGITLGPSPSSTRC